MPERRPVNTMKQTTALTNSLCHAALTKSGSSSAVTPAPRRSSAGVAAASESGSTSRGSVRTRTQPCGCSSDEIHTAAGTTVDVGQNRPTRSVCSTPFCNAHTTVRSSHSRANQAPACSFWVSLTATNTTSTGPSMSAGSVCTGPGSTIGSWLSRASPRSIRGDSARTAARGDRRRADMRRRSHRWRRVR